MNLLVCALEQVMHGGAIVYFDKDRGSELMIRATGGTYLTLRSGEASGLAPLRGLSETAANRTFLEQWLAALMQLDGARRATPGNHAPAVARGDQAAQTAGRKAKPQRGARLPRFRGKR
jgi:type IV secretory pathway VirB4 component